MDAPKVSYRRIFAISAPIMLGSATQNVIALSDSVFLYHRSELEFAAIGFVSVFYLIIAAIGFGFSRGGQILVARRHGADRLADIGHVFRSLLVFEVFLALVLFLFMQFGSYYFFSLFVNSDAIFYKSLDYIYYRSYGVFFAFVGVSIVALYAGIARTAFIIIDTIILAVVNIVLNYALIFGHFGAPEMGIKGAAIASSIAEAVALAVFVVYIVFDKKIRAYRLFTLPEIDWELIRTQYKVSLPIVAQSIVGLGSWFLFFGIIENLGERALAITNLGRIVYLALSIPCWGFAAGVNTLVSAACGGDRKHFVVPITLKAAKLNFYSTMAFALPILLFPGFFLYPLFGSEEVTLVADAQPVFYVILAILAAATFGIMLFNGVVGTGATWYGLKMQFWAALGYVFLIYLVVEILKLGLIWAWSVEILYWLIMAYASWRYLRAGRWAQLEL